MQKLFALVFMVWGIFMATKGLPESSQETLAQIHLTGSWVSIVIGGAIAVFGWSLWASR